MVREMSRKLPKKLQDPRERTKNNIMIICEGQEYEEYIKALKNLGVWKTDIYNFYTSNAETAYNIVNLYDQYMKDKKYAVVLIFCDTDRVPYDAFMSIKSRLRKIYGGNSGFNHVVIYANPCTMRVVLAHSEKKNKIRTQNKFRNSSLIAKLTGVKNYKAHKKQIIDICKKITCDNYTTMKENITYTETKNYEIIGSTNFELFLERFESEDTSWIDDINNALGYHLR